MRKILPTTRATFSIHCFQSILALSAMTPFLIGASLATAQAQVHLLPVPRDAHFGSTIELSARISVSAPGRDAQDEFAAQDLIDTLKAQEIKVSAPASAPYRVVLLRAGSLEGKVVLNRNHLAFDAAMEQEGYVLVIAQHEATIVANSASGVFYGVQTFKQLLPLPGEPRVLPTGTVRDWPAMKYRGIHDDLSRGPFPTLEFQKHQIRVFASFKINIYSPYFEHTLLYPNQRLAAPPGSSLTPYEIADLVAYARQYHVTIVPEQEAFGHLHQVLKYDLYQDQAETPHGYVLAPGQASTLPLIKGWFTQIADEFPSPFIHIGADETFDLGIGRTRDAVQTRGYGPVYMDFLKQIHDALAPLNRRLIFWGDIGDANPDAVASLPRDMIAVPWEYDLSSGFDKIITPFTENRIETWVSPGVSNWKEVYPLERIALGNIQGFIRDGQRLGATGALTTVWNDDGEGLFNLDWYGVLFGAAAAWQPGESSVVDFQNAYGQVFHLDSSGKINTVEKELIAAQDAIANAKTNLNSDTLFWLDPWSAEGQDISEKLLPVVHDLRLHAERAIVLLAEVRAENKNLRESDALAAMELGARRLDLIGMKFELAAEMASLYVQAATQQHDSSKHTATAHLLNEISGANGRCQDLRDAYSAVKGEYAAAWMSENRPYWLNNVTVRYDLEIERWQRRADQIQAATRAWGNGKDLPAPAALRMEAQ